MSFTIQSPTAEFSCSNCAFLFLTEWNELAPQLNCRRLDGGDLSITIDNKENPVDLKIREFIAIHEFGAPSHFCDAYTDELSKRYEFHLSGKTVANERVKLRMYLTAQSDDNGENWDSTFSYKLRYPSRIFQEN